MKNITLSCLPLLIVLPLFLITSCRPATPTEGSTGRTTTAVAPEQSRKLALTREMVINEVAKGDAGMLVDEQGSAGEQAPVHRPQTTWSVKVPEGEVGWYLPAGAVIDLGREHVLTRVLLYDGDGQAGPVRLSYGTPFRWTPLLTEPLTGSNAWNEHRLEGVRTRNVQVLKETDADLREVVLYGYPVGPEPEPVPEALAQRPPRPLLQHGIGINSYIDDPLDKVLVAGLVREYHHWHYNEGGFMEGYPGYPNNQVQWSPASAGGPGFNSIRGYPNDLREWKPKQTQGVDFDAYYKKMKDLGIIVFPAIQGTVPWVNGEQGKNSRHKPVPAGADPANPASYAAHADFLYQYAARYGHTRVPEEKLKLAPNQLKVSGLGYLDYYENWNEPDGWWGGRSDYFSPYEYAAMSSADYDGHEGTMGKDKGIKNADPQAKLVMSGIAIPSPDYIRAMQFWFEHNRQDKRFVFDVITVHHYANAGGGQAVMTKGISPEEDDMKGVMQRVTDYRNKYLPGKEVWMTEFGWDSNNLTPQSAPNEEVQGQWLVRAFLACLAGGMDRVAMYMLPDTNPTSTTQFTASGLIGPRSKQHTKPSWYYLNTLRHQLTGMVFHGEKETGSPQVRSYTFKNPETGEGVYVLWCPTSNGTEVKNFALKLNGSPATATLVMMQDKREKGVSRELPVQEGTVLVDVSERPVFVRVDKMP